MGVGAGLYMYVVKKFTFAVSSPDEFLYLPSTRKLISTDGMSLAFLCSPAAEYHRVLAGTHFHYH